MKSILSLIFVVSTLVACDGPNSGVFPIEEGTSGQMSDEEVLIDADGEIDWSNSAIFSDGCLSGIVVGSFEEVDASTAIVNLRESMVVFAECDPFREQFDVGGRLTAPKEFYETRLSHLQAVVREMKYALEMFDSMPTLVQRQLLKDGLPLVAEYLVEYLHPDYIEEWILNLEWERDIQSLDADWYKAPHQPDHLSENVTCLVGCSTWPDDRTEKVSIDGYHEPISKIDLYVRMFWKRRGEYFFDATQTAFKGLQEVSED